MKKKSFVFVDFKLHGSLLIFGDAHQLLLLLQSNTLILPVQVHRHFKITASGCYVTVMCIRVDFIDSDSQR